MRSDEASSASHYRAHTEIVGAFDASLGQVDSGAQWTRNKRAKGGQMKRMMACHSCLAGTERMEGIHEKGLVEE